MTIDLEDHMLLPCRIRDAYFETGAGQVVLNTDHVIWFCPHPEEEGVTMVRLTHGEAMIILAPFEDVRQEIEHDVSA